MSRARGAWSRRAEVDIRSWKATQTHPTQPSTVWNLEFLVIMPFLVLGLIVTTIGVWMYRMNKRDDNDYGMNGSMILIIVGLVLAIIFGLIYSGAIRLP